MKLSSTTLMLITVLVAGFSAPVSCWEDAELGVRFQNPERWEAKSNDAGAVVRFVAPKTHGLRSNIGLQVADLGEVDSLSREQILTVARGLAGELKDYRMLGTKPYSVAGIEGHRMSYVATVGGKKVQATQVFLVRSGRLLLFTLTTDPENHQAHRKFFDLLLNTVEWTQESG